MASSFTCIADDDQHLIGYCGNMALAVYRGMPTIEAARINMSLIQELDEKYKRDFGALVMPYPQSKPPTPEFRVALKETLTKYNDMKAGMTIVILGENVKATAFRMAGRAFQLFARFDIKFASSLDEALRYHKVRSAQVDDDGIREALAKDLEAASAELG